MEKEKRFKDMTDKEFMTAKSRARDIPFSPFAIFMFALNKYRLQYKGRDIYKYEVYEMGYKNAQDILDDKTTIKLIPIKKDE